MATPAPDADAKENVAGDSQASADGKKLKRKLSADDEVTQGSEKRAKGQAKPRGPGGTTVPKQPLLSSTNSKLAGFAFNKN